MGAALALAASILWGTGDFLGGRATRDTGVLRVLAWSQVATLLLMWSVVAVLVAVRWVDVPLETVLLGAAAGIAGVIGLGAFYLALAAGPMAVVPPIAATGVAVPVAVGLAGGEAPGVRVLVGIALAVVGVVLASVGSGAEAVDGSPGQRIAPRTLALCLVAAAGFAMVFVALDAAAGDSVRQAVVATAAVRAGGVAVLVVALLATRTDPRMGVAPRSAAVFVGIGVIDTSANLAYALASALGRLEVVAVLGSLYPAVASALAHVVLGERLGRVQAVGAVLALAGVLLLAGT